MQQQERGAEGGVDPVTYAPRQQRQQPESHQFQGQQKGRYEKEVPAFRGQREQQPYQSLSHQQRQQGQQQGGQRQQPRKQPQGQPQEEQRQQPWKHPQGQRGHEQQSFKQGRPETFDIQDRQQLISQGSRQEEISQQTESFRREKKDYQSTRREDKPLTPTYNQGVPLGAEGGVDLTIRTPKQQPRQRQEQQHFQPPSAKITEKQQVEESPEAIYESKKQIVGYMVMLKQNKYLKIWND